MKARVTLLNSDHPAEFVVKLPAVIGRSQLATLHTTDPFVSRKHCILFVHHKRLCVQDMHSTNGTFVNTRRVLQTTPLALSDLLKIGSLVLRVLPAETEEACESPADGVAAVDGDNIPADTDVPAGDTCEPIHSVP